MLVLFAVHAKVIFPFALGAGVRIDLDRGRAKRLVNVGVAFMSRDLAGRNRHLIELALFIGLIGVVASACAAKNHLGETVVFDFARAEVIGVLGIDGLFALLPIRDVVRAARKQVVQILGVIGTAADRAEVLRSADRGQEIRRNRRIKTRRKVITSVVTSLRLNESEINRLFRFVKLNANVAPIPFALARIKIFLGAGKTGRIANQSRSAG